MSVPYKGDAALADSASKIAAVIPWYEYALYVFRHEGRLRRLLSSRGPTGAAPGAVPSEDVNALSEALVALEQIKKNLMFLCVERASIASKLGAARGARAEGGFPGFFLDTRSPGRVAPVEATAANELRLQEAFLERGLEYGSRVPMDRFMILNNEYFRSIVGETLAVDAASVAPAFSRLSYSPDADTFAVLFGADGVDVTFRIAADSGYPHPVLVKISSAYQSEYVYGGYSDERGRYPVTLIERDAQDVQDMLAQWVEVDGKLLQYG